MFLHEDRKKFQQAVSLTSFRSDRMGKIIEKDYYVTMILRFLADEMPFVVFKGGTSLSKCHQAILRFSEDIDIAVDHDLSQGKKKKLKYEIADIAQRLGLKIVNIGETRSRRDYNRYIIAYDSILPQINEAIQPVILLETSFTARSFPLSLCR